MLPGKPDRKTQAYADGTSGAAVRRDDETINGLAGRWTWIGINEKLEISRKAEDKNHERSY
jgi:hypothetical protein